MQHYTIVRTAIRFIASGIVLYSVYLIISVIIFMISGAGRYPDDMSAMIQKSQNQMLIIGMIRVVSGVLLFLASSFLAGIITFDSKRK